MEEKVMGNNEDKKINQNNINTDTGEQELDIAKYVTLLWHHRRFIIKVTLIFLLIGLLIALLSPAKYSAKTIMVPQVENNQPRGSIGGLASMMGIDMGSMMNNEILSPVTYPKILKSSTFQKELIYTPIKFKRYDNEISLYSYYTEIRKPSIFELVKKYTIGLPWVIIGAFKKGGDESIQTDSSEKVVSLTEDELLVIEQLNDILTIDVDTKEGDITISATFVDPLATTYLVKEAQQLLQNYIAEYKVEKISQNLKFIEERYNEVKQTYNQRHSEYARLSDSNIGLSTASSRIRLQRLEDEVRLQYSLYSELAKQLERTRIAEKETTPLLTIIDPVTIPLKKSQPQKTRILFIATLIGFIIGVGTVLFIPPLGRMFGFKKLERWFPEPSDEIVDEPSGK